MSAGPSALPRALAELLLEAERDRDKAASESASSGASRYESDILSRAAYEQRLRRGLESLADNGAPLSFGERLPHHYWFRAHDRRSTSTSSLAGAIRNWIAAATKAEGRAT